MDGCCYVLGYFNFFEMKSYNCIDKVNIKIWNLKYIKVMYIWNFFWFMVKNIKNIIYLNLIWVLYVIFIYMYICVVYICILILFDFYIIRYGIYIYCFDIILKLYFWFILLKENIIILYIYFFYDCNCFLWIEIKIINKIKYNYIEMKKKFWKDKEK